MATAYALHPHYVGALSVLYSYQSEIDYNIWIVEDADTLRDDLEFDFRRMSDRTAVRKLVRLLSPNVWRHISFKNVRVVRRGCIVLFQIRSTGMYAYAADYRRAGIRRNFYNLLGATAPV